MPVANAAMAAPDKPANSPPATRILIIDDDRKLCRLIKDYLEPLGYSVQAVHTGAEGADRALAEPWHAVILDLMLPGCDGFEVLKRIRKQSAVPVLMLTARGRSEDVMNGFEAGADDYLPKPFELGILMARMKALLRRSEWNAAPIPPSDVFEFDGRRIDFSNLELTGPAGTLRLTVMEAQLLKFLVAHRGQVVSRKTILEEVWGLHEETDTRAIDNFIVRLRRQIEDDPTQPRHLLTVRGVGDRFEG